MHRNKGRIKIINQKARTKRGDKSYFVNQSPCLIQPVPSMKTVSNHKTFRDSSLPKFIASGFNSLVEAKIRKDKKIDSRNKTSIIFPKRTKDMNSPSSSIVNSACSLASSNKEKKNQSIIQCKRKKYKYNY